MLALWLAATLSPLAETVVLERGVGGYWSVEDTSLDSRDPEASRGGNAILEGGPGKTVLIQFRDLDRVLHGKRVTSAKMELVFGGGRAAPKLLQIRTLNRPWTEGPIRALAPQMRGGSSSASRWASTWKVRRNGADPDPWQLEGARGNDDATKIEGIETASSDDVFTISGLGATIERMRAKPYDNNGFALELADPIDFISSNGPEGRPRLVLEVEAAPAAKGPDLSVVLIRRTPEYPRFDPKYVTVDGVEAPEPLDASVKRWPVEAEELTYEAVVKNLGDAAAPAFKGQWWGQEKPKDAVEGKALAPGESQTFTFKAPYRSLHSDHRTAPIAFRVESGDENPGNDFLEIQQSALNFAVYVEPSLAEKVGPKWEDWVQLKLREFNEIYCRYSRYSFAPEGALERGRIQTLAIKPETIPDDKNVDATIVLDGNDPMLAIAKGFGLIDLHGIGGPDIYGGLLGGDTRSDAPFPPTYAFPFGPDPDPVANSLALDTYHLLSAFDVAALTSSLGSRRGYRGDILYDLPENVIVTAQDRLGNRLPKVKLSFVQSGESKDTFSLITGDGGGVTLPNRAFGASSSIRTLSKHTLRTNPFGRISPDGRNTAFLVTLEHNGVTETAWLESWQMTQNLARGQFPIGFISLRFNVPGAPLTEPVYTSAEPKPVTGDVIDFDLGKQGAIGEIRIKAKDMWSQFDIVVRGSKDAEGVWRLYGKEIAAQMRMEDGVLIYRGFGKDVSKVQLRKVSPAPKEGGVIEQVVVVGARG